MSGDAPVDDIPPPAAFLQAQSRVRKRRKVCLQICVLLLVYLTTATPQAKNHRSNASVISGETATTGASLHTASIQSDEQVEPEASLEAASAEATNVEAVQTTYLATDAETAAPDIPLPEFVLNTTDVETAANIPLPESVCDAQEQLTQRSAEDITPISPQAHIAPNSEPRNLTQNNLQYNNSNTYNVTYTNNNYFGDGASSDSYDSGGGGGGGRGGRWCPLGFSPFCAFPLFLILMSVFFVIAAIYGVATFWNNTVSSVQSLASTVTSIFSLGFLASKPTIQTSTSPPITIVKPTIMTDRPTPIVHSPEGIVKAFDDLNHWVKQLQDCQEAKEKSAEHQLFFQHFDISLTTISGMRDSWVILMEDILTLEKKLRKVFGLLDRDMTKLGRDLGANPAAKCWIREAEASTWDKILYSMPWSSHLSPIQVLFTNYERIKTLSVEVQRIRVFFAHQSLKSIQQQVQSLSDVSCGLRDSVEISGEKLSRKADEKLEGGISAVVSRGNLLCDLFLRADQRVQRFQHLFDKVMDDQQMANELGETMKNLDRLKSVSLADVKMIELELQEWVDKMTGSVKKLYSIDVDN
ncbi:hypothetical protein BHE90_016841 [Fusarium euwallaceae]|uniref:Uncharacterized protein n=1 Tax=Fusarium euwallaceae TaxID=1147111 RepID=A0A430KZ90_9HYPO|nr:hypothetical protein BHE90_016841 [Fusarium euwallaceae]